MCWPTTSTSPTWLKPLAFHAAGIAGEMCFRTFRSSSVRHKLSVAEKIQPPAVRATPWLYPPGNCCSLAIVAAPKTGGGVVVVVSAVVVVEVGGAASGLPDDEQLATAQMTKPTTRMRAVRCCTARTLLRSTHSSDGARDA